MSFETLEQNGFLAILGTRSKPSTTEGALLLGGMALAFGLGFHAKSFAKVEEQSSKEEIAAVLGYSVDPSDLPMLQKLPLEALEAGVVVRSGSGIDWDQTNERMAVFDDMPLHIMKFARVPKSQWIDVWKEVVASDDAGNDTQMDMLYKLGAVGELVRSKSGAALVEKLSKKCTPFYLGKCGDSNKHAIRRLSKVAKSGVLKQLDDLYQDLEKSGAPPDSDAFATRARALYKYADDLIGWTTLQELDEQIAKAEHEAQWSASPKKKRLDDPFKKEKRAFDRLAQVSPDWAISEYPYEYQRGKRIANLMDEATRYVIDLANKGQKVVIHGRDGEMIIKMLERYPNVKRQNISYVLSSRPLTTEGPLEPKTEVDKDYRKYLLRVIPEGAVHVDTGFKGRIPRWLDANVVKIGPIRMISAFDPSEEMPIMPGLSRKKKRRIVLSDLEYSSQRLDLPKVGGWDNVTYSYGAPGFWARFYGIMDALRMPRQREPKLTRFETRGSM